MERILHGSIKAEGCGLAGKRLRHCALLLSEYGILFPPLYFGTVNIKLDESFPTPEGEDVIFILQEKIDTVAPGYCEWWKFIPVKKINDLDIKGYIFRNRQHVHGDDGAELITVDLRSDLRFDLSVGKPIALHI